MKNQKAFPDPMRGTNPSYRNPRPDRHEEGMDLRDYFAAKAMQAFLSNQNAERFSIHSARRQYEIADAMMAARKTKDNE